MSDFYDDEVDDRLTRIAAERALSDPASPRTAESRDLRGDVDETPPIEPGHRSAPEARATLRASMEAWYAAVAARDQKGSWRAANEMHIAIARFLTPPLPDDEVRRLRAIEAAAMAVVILGRHQKYDELDTLRAALAERSIAPPLPDDERLREAAERFLAEYDSDSGAGFEAVDALRAALAAPDSLPGYPGRCGICGANAGRNRCVRGDCPYATPAPDSGPWLSNDFDAEDPTSDKAFSARKGECPCGEACLAGPDTGAEERLRAAAQAVLDAVEPIPLGPGMSRTPHVGHRHEAVIALRAALASHPSEPQEP